MSMILTAKEAAKIVKFRPILKILKEIKNAAKEGYSSETFILTDVQLELLQEYRIFCHVKRS